jgi:hypothetical protein
VTDLLDSRPRGVAGMKLSRQPEALLGVVSKPAQVFLVHRRGARSLSDTDRNLGMVDQS